MEFGDLLGTDTLAARQGSPAAQRVDLLTTIMHEMGHLLGYDHTPSSSLMIATLPLSARRTIDHLAMKDCLRTDLSAIDRMFAMLD